MGRLGSQWIWGELEEKLGNGGEEDAGSARFGELFRLWGWFVLGTRDWVWTGIRAAEPGVSCEASDPWLNDHLFHTLNIIDWLMLMLFVWMGNCTSISPILATHCSVLTLITCSPHTTRIFEYAITSGHVGAKIIKLYSRLSDWLHLNMIALSCWLAR